MAELQVQKVNWWHERLAEWMLANPNKNLKDAAPVFNVTPTTIYLIHNSDAFKEHWAKVSGGVTSGTADHIVEKCRAVAEMALDQVLDRLAIPASVGTMEAVDIADRMLKRMGMGPERPGLPPPGPVQVNIVNATPAALEAARAKLEAFTARAGKPLVIESASPATTADSTGSPALLGTSNPSLIPSE